MSRPIVSMESITLSEEQIKYIEAALPFDLGFPHNFCVSRLLLMRSVAFLTSTVRTFRVTAPSMPSS